MNDLFVAQVLAVHHWTDRLFSFTTTRDPGFRFQSGQFTMIGLMVDGRPLLRAYSMVSPHYQETLEFLSIKVPGGALTSRLQNVQAGDTVLVGRRASGSLLTQNLLPGRRLYLLATGTGLAPFMSVVRDPDVYEQYEKIVLVHGCRQARELAYNSYITRELPQNEWLGRQVTEKLLYYPTVTREAFQHRGRIPALLENGQLSHDLDLSALPSVDDRFMLCGSPPMLRDTRTLLDRHGQCEGSMSVQGQYVIERAFVE